MSHSTSYYDNRFIQKDTKIVQIEIDPNEIGRNYPVAVGIEGDAKAVSGQILELVRAAEQPRNEQWDREVRDLAQKRLQRLDDHGKLDGTPMHPDRIYYELRKVMPGGRHRRSRLRPQLQLRLGRPGLSSSRALS